MSRISQNQIFTLIGTLYDCAQANTPDAWLDVYKKMSEMFSSGPGSLSLYSFEKEGFDFVAHTFSPDDLRTYYDHYQYISPVRKQLARLKPGERFWRQRDCPDSDFVPTEFYQDHLRKVGIYDFNYYALFEHDGVTGGMSFTRAESEPAFSADEIAAMEFILPHIQRAFRVYLTVSDAERDSQIMAETLGCIPRSVIIVDRTGKIVFSNAAAEKVTANKDGLEIDRTGRVVASLSQESKQLRMVLDGVFAPELDRPSSFGGALLVSRPSGKRPLQVLVSPISGETGNGFSPVPLAIMFINDPENNAAAVEDVLRQMYHLTQAEARLAAILASGNSLNDARRQLGVTQNTLRTHLKHIFLKTDTNRQSELITLILSGPAILKSGN